MSSGAVDYIKIMTTHFNKFIPKCAVDLKIGATALSYLHPTRGWKRVSFKRMGISPPAMENYRDEP